MAANRQQGGYLVAFIVAFTALPVGLVGLVHHRMLVGSIVSIGGLLLLVYALLGLRRLRPLEFLK